MKKSLITLMLGSVFFLCACEDEKLSQKLLAAEQKIAQLEAEHKNAQQVFPGLQVEIVEFFNKSTVLQHKNAADESYFSQKAHVSVYASVANTGIEWLDSLLMEKMFFFGVGPLESMLLTNLPMLNNVELESLPEKSESEKALREALEEEYQSMIAFEEEYQSVMALDPEEPEDPDRIIYPRELVYSIITNYIGQRHNIATFKQLTHTNGGGAHGIYRTNYLNIDLNKKAIIRLGDLVNEENQAKLRAILWQVKEQKKLSGLTEKAFYVSDQFYFTPNGINFVYPVYSLGSFAEGEIELEGYFYEINELLNPEYQRTKKDGFGL